MPAILEVQDIHTYYGDAYVLQGLSLRLEQGQILGLLGRNGVGKSTLVNSIVGFTPPRRGKIVFKGDDITHKLVLRNHTEGHGVVPQGRRVFPTLSVEENLLVAERSTERHGWNLERVYNMFPRLRERRDQRAKTLSGGEQQMLAIGRGLMTNPDCLIMDEPSEGLAPIIIQGVWEEAIGKLKKEGLSILLVEQNASLAQARRLRPRHEQGPSGLFVAPGGTVGQRRDQAQLSGYLTARGKLAIIQVMANAAGVIPWVRTANKIPANRGLKTITSQGENAMSIKRRSVLKGMLATGASIATIRAPAVHAQAAPFKLGLLTVKTGPLAQGGIQMEQGVLTF